MTVPEPSRHFRQLATRRLAQLAVPPGSLGKLGEVGVWIAAAQGCVPPRALDAVRLVIFAGDHGVADHGVSAFPSALTGAITRAAVCGQLATNALAAANNVSVRVLDIAVDDDFDDIPDDLRTALQLHKIRKSCSPIHQQDALTADEVSEALKVGAEVAREEVAAGAQLLLSGDLGIGNTTPAAALIAAHLRLTAHSTVGRGTGIDDVMLEHKVGVVQQALDRVGERISDPVDTLAALGSADLAATTGYLITAAQLRVPVLLDGLMAVACALTADRIAPGAAAWFAAGHRSTEPAQSLALDEMGLQPLIDLGLRVGEGSGAVTAVPLVRSAITLLRDVALLDDLSVQ
ncbi:nicotinate-nucleotide--dimethylbenzimidazole phosphoribosyltransferase [Rhodococcus sp. ADH]|nr:nicotinate-nucleotide--dimethylbenzimidazole phosphoribosyltransferase [Rhodococcus sp. ADH]RGP48027.1 nicotinate-nucleotide--dimethylbenzimidazole phosphoribosyltransferase [Rhodococcus erythropolis]